MSTPYLLHAFTPLPNMSPFDVNMAYDAGYDAVTPYTGLTREDIRAYTQDVIFSRSPDDALRTGIFIGGRDAELAVDMLEEAKGAMLPPFAVSVFADPSGAFTTAAAMVAVVEKHLRAGTGSGLEGRRVAVFGATGVVAGVAAIIAAQVGALVTLVGHRPSDLPARAAAFERRFGVRLAVTDAFDGAARRAVVHGTEVLLCSAKAGVQVLGAAELAGAPDLRVIGDVNAVPPAGVEGVGVMDDGAPVPDTAAVGVGALAIGNIKFKVQHEMFQAMRRTDAPLYLSFAEAFAHARDLVT